PWTIRDFIERSWDIPIDGPLAELTWVNDEDDSGSPIVLHCYTPEVDESSTIEEVLGKWVPLLRQHKDEIIADLATREHRHSVIARFNLPEPYKVAAEQYLLYFAEFLGDLGVVATADVKHEGLQAVLTVTPQSREQALSAISDALSAYLSLPA